MIDALEKLFPNSKILNTNHNRIVIQTGINLLSEKLKQLIFEDLERSSSSDDEDDEIDERVDIYIDFDTPETFLSNEMAVKSTNADSGSSKLKIMGVCEIGIRIPYFVKLDQVTANHFFGIKTSLNKVTQGFADKSVLPDKFSRNGEILFWKHMKNLPLETGVEIYQSLINLSLPKENVCSKRLWLKLIERFDKETAEFVEQCRKLCNGYTDKYYKYLPDKTAKKLAGDYLARILWNNNLNK